MKRLFLRLLLMLMLISACHKDNDSDIPSGKSDIGIRVKNVSDILFEELVVAGYGPELKYLNISPGETSAYQKLQSDMRPDVFLLHNGKDTLGVVYDYTPEYYNMEKGLYTLEVDNSLSSIKYIKD